MKLSDKTRREFLKSCYRIGGVAAIVGLGMGAVEDARGWGILPALTGGGGAGSTVQSWAAWDESSEATLASDDTFVAFFEGGNSANETGQGGGLTGADLVLTQTGSIAAAAGSPPKRLVDRPNGDYFSATAAALKAFFNGQTFTFIAKCNNLSATGGMLEFYDGARHLVCDTHGRFYTGSYSVNSDVYWVADPALPTGDIYYALWDDASTTKWGWTVTKPTKLSNFASANNYVSKASINGIQVNMTRTGVMGTSDTGTSLVTYAYYVVFSHLCLINNAA